MKLPEVFIKNMQVQLGDDLEDFLQSFQKPVPVSIRLNPRKLNSFVGERIPWTEQGYYLVERPSFSRDPLFHAGAYYVQEASSMVLEKFFKHAKSILGEKPIKVLDLCAAPGGKSTHLLSLMSDKDLLITNEIIPKRNLILQENIIKWGYSNLVVSQNKTEDFSALSGYFDIILVDAPCSGEGMFRKDDIAIREWSPAHVETCSVRQKHILNSILPALNEGGFIIYSTCTYNNQENSEQVKNVLDRGMLKLSLPHLDEAIFTSTGYGYQMYPHKIKGEGLFMSSMQKTGFSPTNIGGFSGNGKKYFQWRTEIKKGEAEDFADTKKCHLLMNYKNQVVCFRNDFKEDLKILDEQLHITYAGVTAGVYKGNSFIPSYELGLSVDCIAENVKKLPLQQEDAIKYLKKESIFSDSLVKPGFNLVDFNGAGLGWVKVLPNRINNLYPVNLRIT